MQATKFGKNPQDSQPAKQSASPPAGARVMQFLTARRIHAEECSGRDEDTPARFMYLPFVWKQVIVERRPSIQLQVNSFLYTQQLNKSKTKSNQPFKASAVADSQFLQAYKSICS